MFIFCALYNILKFELFGSDHVSVLVWLFSSKVCTSRTLTSEKLAYVVYSLLEKCNLSFGASQKLCKVQLPFGNFDTASHSSSSKCCTDISLPIGKLRINKYTVFENVALTADPGNVAQIAQTASLISGEFA